MTIHLDNHWKRLILPIAAVLSLLACNTNPQVEQDLKGVSQAVQDSLTAIDKASFPSICLREFNCVTNSFGTHFKYRLNATSPKKALTNNKEELRWDILDSLVTVFRDPDGDKIDDAEIGIRVHYGLMNSASTSLAWGLEIVQVIPENGSPVFYTVNDSVDTTISLVQENATLNDLNKNEWYSAMRQSYFQRVVLRRTNEVIWHKVILGNDYESYTFRWTDIKQLYAENLAVNSALKSLYLSAIATPATRVESESEGDVEDDWHHEVAIEAGTAALSDERHTNCGTGICYIKKALDLGSPCPPSCKLARFYRYGLAAHSDCEC